MNCAAVSTGVEIPLEVSAFYSFGMDGNGFVRANGNAVWKCFEGPPFIKCFVVVVVEMESHSVTMLECSGMIWPHCNLLPGSSHSHVSAS